MKERKSLLLTLLAWPYLPSGFICPCVNPVFFPWESWWKQHLPLLEHCSHLWCARFSLGWAFMCAWRRMCTRSPDGSPLAVNKILDGCYQGWEADESLHCQQGEVTNYFYGLAFLRMRGVSFPVFQVSDFSFSAIGIPSSCATLSAYLFLEELKRNRTPPLKSKNSNFLGGVTVILPTFCSWGWLFGQCSSSKRSQNGDLKGLQYVLACKPDSCFWLLLWESMNEVLGF